MCLSHSESWRAGCDVNDSMVETLLTLQRYYRNSHVCYLEQRPDTPWGLNVWKTKQEKDESFPPQKRKRKKNPDEMRIEHSGAFVISCKIRSFSVQQVDSWVDQGKWNVFIVHLFRVTFQGRATQQLMILREQEHQEQPTRDLNNHSSIDENALLIYLIWFFFQVRTQEVMFFRNDDKIMEAAGVSSCVHVFAHLVR